MQSVLIAMEGRYEVIISSCTTGTYCQSKVGLALQACEFSFSILNTPYAIFHTLLRMKQVNHCHSWHWKIPPESLLHFLSHQQSTGTRPFSTCRPRNQYVVQSSDLKLLTFRDTVLVSQFIWKRLWSRTKRPHTYGQLSPCTAVQCPLVFRQCYNRQLPEKEQWNLNSKWCKPEDPDKLLPS